MSGKPKDLTGKVFNSLTVVSMTDKRVQRKPIWICKCECGNTVEVFSTALTSGNTKSCGCLSYRKSIKIISPYDSYLNDLESIFGKADKRNDSTFLASGNKVSLVYEQNKLVIYMVLLSASHIELPNIDRNYHLSILKECNTIGYRCFFIYENEWISKQNKIINFLSSILNKNTTTIYARKCTIKQIEKKEAIEFLCKEHIQGSAATSTSFFGLYYQNILISVMSFGRHHRQQSTFNAINISILDRFAVACGYNIPGGASKLLSFAENKLKSTGINKIVSWADRKISEGNLYYKLGFILFNTLVPDYSYWDSTNIVPTILSKQSNKKSCLKTPSNMTEYEHTKQLGRYRIFDLGKLVFTKDII